MQANSRLAPLVGILAKSNLEAMRWTHSMLGGMSDVSNVGAGNLCHHPFPGRVIQSLSISLVVIAQRM